MKHYLKFFLLFFCALSSGLYLDAQEVDVRALNNTPASSMSDALQGQLPWMDVTIPDTLPFIDSHISLRGELSDNGTQPLVLVDGVEMSLDMLDPSVIESVDVIKDAAAASIYGSRASAGAIIVRTKNAGRKTGDSGVNINAFTGISPDTGLLHNYKLSAGGGNEAVSYYFGAHYYGRQELSSVSGPVNPCNKAGVTGNLNARITPWLHYSLSLDYTYKGMTSASGAVEAIKDNAHNILMKNMLTADIVKGLTFDVSYSFRNRYDFITDRVAQYKDPSGITQDHYAEIRNRLTDSDVQAHFNYNGVFNGKHEVRAVLGYDMQFGMNKYVGAAVKDLLDPTLSVLTIGDGHYAVGETKNEYMQCGLFLNGIYTYDKRYNAEITLRGDGNSRLPLKHRYGFSGSGALEWSIDSEDFFAGAKKYVGILKLRYSFASVCNQNLVPFYGWYATVNPEAGMSSFLFDKSGLGTYSAWNEPVASDLKPERVNTHNLSLLAAFLKNRLSFEGAFFSRRINDMLTPNAKVPGIFGSDAPYMNQGSATTNGFELVLGWKDTAECDLTYSVKAMFADHKTSAVSLPDPRLSYAVDASLLWKGLELSVLLNGVGRYDCPLGDLYPRNGYFSVRNVALSYTLPFKEGSVVKSMRFGIVGRNLRLWGQSALLNIGINF